MGAENTLTVRLVECAKTAAQWAALLTIPKRGEICLEMENQGTNENPDLLYKMKIGDGIHTYANLNYFPVDANIAQVVASWVEQNLDVNEYAQASYDDTTKKLSIYGIKEVDGKIVKGANHVDIQLAEGTKIDITSAAGVITIAHEGTTRTDKTKSSAGYGTDVVTGVTTDSTGHVTGVETGPLPTKPATKNVIGTSAAATTDGASANPYLNHIEDGDVKSHHQLIGGTQVDVNSDASGNVTIKHETITRSDAEESAQPTNIVTEITTANGHVTGAKTIKPDDLIVGIAKDLDAPVVRSDNSMWNHRVTGGAINIGEETAKISKLRGNTLVWNQILNDSYITNSSYANTTLTKDGSKIIINGTASLTYDYVFYNVIKWKTGHKYILRHRGSDKIKGAVNVNDRYPSFVANGDVIITATTLNFTMFFVEVTSGVTYVNDYCYFNVFDLTKMFGADNEPATVEEFEALFPNSYYPYNEGELISLNPTGVKSVGFNLWDEEFRYGVYSVTDGETFTPQDGYLCSYNKIPIIGGASYYLKNIVGRLFYYDHNGTFIESIAEFSNPLTIPSNVGYIRFQQGDTYGEVGNICINLSDNDTYEPYKESTLDLNWIKSIKDSEGNQLFPHGLLSAGSVYDEVGDSYAIKRVGVVDLGSLTWEYGDHGFQTKVTNLGQKLNCEALCAKYKTTGTQPLNQQIGFCSLWTGNNYIIFKDENYTDANLTKKNPSDVSRTHAPWLEGVMLYYELEEPVTVYFDKKPMTYPVDDLGTETLLPEGVDSTTGVPLSAPFNGTFEYKSNFKDAVIDLINAVNNYKNPVRGEDNSDQTVGQLAEYDSDSTVKASGYRASNATITPTGSDNASILPTVAALIAYVQGVAQNALHYQGTVATVASLPSTGTTAGDVYILSATDGDYDAGDWFIRNKANDGWDVVQGSVRVTNNDITLNPDGTKKTIANVEGTPITVTMPDMNFAEPAASGDTLTVVDNISQTNGKILATKKNVQSASKSQKGVVQFVTDIHGSSDQTKGVTAADAWTEFSKRNVKAVEVDTVDTLETSSTTLEVIAEGLADLDARLRGIEASIKNGFTSLEVGELVVGYALFARIRRGDFILKGAGAPSSSVVPVDWDEEKYGEWTGIPLYEGQIYIDTTNKIAYISVGVSAVTDWKRITNA